MTFVVASLGLAGLAAWGYWAAARAVRDLDGVFGSDEEEA